MNPGNRFSDRKHLLAMSLVAVVISVGLAFLFLKTDLIPNPSSMERGPIDTLIRTMFAIAAIFFAVITTVFVYSLIFFRRQPGDTSDGPPIRGNPALEIIWTVIPLAIVIGLGVYGAMVLNRITIPPQVPTPAPPAEFEVDVLAFRFGWQFTYPQYGIKSFNLEVPVNQEIVFHIQSKDVVHSFWVQEWGPKQDAVPGLTTEVRITPTKIGTFQVQCSQLCGYGHTYMTAPVFVVSRSDFDTWVKQQQMATPTPIPTPTTTPTPPTGQNVTINLIAKNIAFNLSTITVPAGSQVTINFDNQDTGVQHNFALYTDASATTAIYHGQIITGPATTIYIFTAPSIPGNYFFRCDVHPTLMTGTFVVH